MVEYYSSFPLISITNGKFNIASEKTSVSNMIMLGYWSMQIAVENLKLITPFFGREPQVVDEMKV